MKPGKSFFIFSLFFLIFSSLHAADSTAPSPDEQKMIRDLESELSPMKEQVFQTKTKVQDLKESVLHGKIIGSKAFISFENRAEGFFSFVSAEFFLDNELIKKIVVGKDQKTPSKVEIFNSDIPSGDHALKAKITYRGSDRSIYKAFAYFKGHEFLTESNENFSVDYGKTTTIKITTLDKGYFQNKIDERLYMQINISQEWGTEISE